ncbi:uncharacterized protein BDZ99DRAFT_207192 [Mytilinidion resinicola]|uniref:Uncharacterized protein n=1 Tax=Mytilinidion resinicola TaxID=574789 RepID=A0A6A6Y2L9_9PEZI|nr:uncharacterized protein BDZ99DRAFT_207192 [Mytilinidion resinicola]KAF2802254.1 hypothetical protein BDZ99DRAFT_207192 [Mytilinidion resinicola]
MPAPIGVARRVPPLHFAPPTGPGRQLFWRPPRRTTKHHTTPRQHRTRLQEPALRALAILSPSPQLRRSISFRRLSRPSTADPPPRTRPLYARPPSKHHSGFGSPRSSSPPAARPINVLRIRCTLPVHVRSAAAGASLLLQPFQVWSASETPHQTSALS